jgi:hypothetical protein
MRIGEQKLLTFRAHYSSVAPFKQNKCELIEVGGDYEKYFIYEKV